MSQTLADTNELYFDADHALLTRDCQRIKLDPITTKLLIYFLAHPDQIVSRAQLAEQVWQSSYVSDDAVNRGVSVLRKALGGQLQTYIKTMPKMGYCFSLPQGSKLHQTPDDAVKSNDDKSDDSSVAVDDLSKTKAITETVPSQGTEKTNGKSFVRYKFPLLCFAGLTLIAFIVLFFITKRQPTALPTTINIAVLPFTKLTDDANQQYFVDGLSEEVLNGLTRIKGLLVVERADSFAVRDHSNDNVRVAEALSVQYLLKGSVRKNGNQLRITVHLIDTDTGVYLFSTVFERELNDVFAIQKDISTQVASALKLTLQHSDKSGQHPYSSALATLDHASVEKLVIARAQINQYQQKSVENALTVLKNLNRQFPGTPEILGLLSYGHAALTSTDSTKTSYRRATEVNFARQALDLDPTNFDALTTLFYFYLNFADLRGKAQQVSEAALRYHPGNKTAYKMALRLLVSAVSSCEKLQNFIQSTPGGVFAADQLKAIKTVINHCNDPSKLASIEPGQEFYVNGVINFFALNDDRRFSTINDLAQRYRNQIVFNDQLQQQLAMGINVTPDNVAPGSRSAGTDKQLWRPTLYRYINYQPTSKAPSQLVEFARNMTRNDANPYFVAALVLQSQTASKDEEKSNINTVLSDYLAKVPSFTIEPQNNNETIGLLMLQYHTGHLEQSRHSATTLLNKLNQYQRQHPQAYQFWSLAKAQFIGALYAEKWVEAKNILNSGFAADEAYWQHDKALMQIVLAPWAGHPMAVDLVTRYLNRIEADQERARQKFDLQ